MFRPLPWQQRPAPRMPSHVETFTVDPPTVKTQPVILDQVVAPALEVEDDVEELVEPPNTPPPAARSRLELIKERHRLYLARKAEERAEAEEAEEEQDQDDDEPEPLGILEAIDASIEDEERHAETFGVYSQDDELPDAGVDVDGDDE